MPSFTAVAQGDTMPINYVYNDEVPVSTVITQWTAKVIQHAVPPTTLQDAQQCFDGSDKDLAALDMSAELGSYHVQSFESSTVVYNHSKAAIDISISLFSICHMN